MYQLEVLNPVAQLRESLKTKSSDQKLSRRPATLDGKIVGLVWNGYGTGDQVLQGVGEIFKEQFRDVRIKFYNGGHRASAHMLGKIAAECDVVVGGFGD